MASAWRVEFAQSALREFRQLDDRAKAEAKRAIADLEETHSRPGRSRCAAILAFSVSVFTGMPIASCTASLGSNAR